DIVIKGTIENKRSFQINEYDESGKVTAKFIGNFPAKDPHGQLEGELQQDVMTGNWTKTGDTAALPFYLTLDSEGNSPELGAGFYQVAGVEDDRRMEDTARKFREAVINGAKEQVAGFIHFPISVKINNKQKAIKTRAEFIQLYDQIFTTKY